MFMPWFGWPEKMDDIRPADALTIRFSYGSADETRYLTFDAMSDRWKKLATVIQS